MLEPLKRSSTSQDVRPKLSRAKSDYGPRMRNDVDSESEPEWGIRHGFETQLESEEWNNLLTSNFFLYYTDKKHETGGNPKYEESSMALQEWRMKDRLKTVSAVLALCLNIGVEPPDVIKPNPCAKEEAWIDPSTIQPSSTTNAPLHAIGKALQSQYEQLSMRTRYKCALDPTMEETKKFATGLRKNARNERILFHYNGHGVPKPTPSGEIWVFNRNYTQYIPISLYDLQSWTSGPSIFVWDCSDAGIIISNFQRFAEKIDSERRDENGSIIDTSDCIHLAACRNGESLPTNPQLPADVFTSCLTTPIKMAVRFFILQNPLKSSVTLNDASMIPGTVAERRTPLGELNWIFTAITDTIAWDALPKPLFKKLFRQDLMVAALYRNFLLAQRIMRKYHCNPQSFPEIPQVHHHPLWASWDLAVEALLSQLPDLVAAQRGEKEYDYRHSNFFSEQLTAFEVYLAQDAVDKKVPEQLPVVLQVLLSQVHRLRALILLSKFLDLGPWAVNLALGIGIFPYVLKLLQSQAMELKPVMIFIWTRILAVDSSVQTDLLKDNGYQYFCQILNPAGPGVQGVPNVAEHRAMCAFILAMFCKGFPQGQQVCMSTDLMDSCLTNLNDKNWPLLRQWSCLCLSMLWLKFPEAQWMAINRQAHQKLCDLVVDCVAEVRAAMLYALTSFLGIPNITPHIALIEEQIASMVLIMASDGNTMVRKELLVFFSHFIARYQNRFLVAAYEQLISEATSNKADHRAIKSMANDVEDAGYVASQSVYSAIWTELLILAADPYPEIAENACQVLDSVYSLLLVSPLASYAAPLIEKAMKRRKSMSKVRSTEYDSSPSSKDHSRPPSPPTPSRNEGYLTASLKRTASVAASLKNFALGFSTPTESSRPYHTNSMVNLPVRTGSRIDLNHEKITHTSHKKTITIPLPHGYRPSYLSAPPSQSTQPKVHVLESKFFDWAMEYFREPQMQSPEADEPGSMDYNERLWRRNRNDRIIAKTQPLKEMAGTSPWDKPKGFFNNGSQPIKICWHQFEEHLIVTDDTDGISVWDYKRSERLNRFSNGNPDGSHITKVRLINEDDQAFLMTGSSDGVIKVFRDYETRHKTELVSSFRALTDLEQSTKSAGLVFEWLQSRGQILVAGDVRSIRVWNAGTEICIADINARSGAPITDLTSDQVEGWIFAAGFGDGAVRIYDQRNKPQSALVRIWKEHKSWVTNVHLQRGGQRELISASRNGDVKLWDMRMSSSLSTVIAAPYGLRTMAVHEHAPVFAVGGEKGAVRIWSTGGKMLSAFEPYTSSGLSGALGNVLGGKGQGVSAVAFHPHRMMVAGAAVGETWVNLFGCGRKGDKEIF